jgi:CRP-like cAMP-binding protein
MNKEKLRQFIQTIYPVSDEKARKLTDDFEYFIFPKNKLLLEEKKINKHSYFVEEGYIRSFVFDRDGLEVTTNIFSAPCFVNDFLSFFKQEPVRENYQSTTICKGWKMSFELVEDKFHHLPEFREFGRFIIIHNYEMLKERMLEMIQDTAEDRYLKLLTKHPGIFQNVPLKMIASYLGITDTSLSRIRKELFQK